MNGKKIEIRTVMCGMAFREADPAAAEKGNLGTISGTSIVFDTESRVIDEYGETFREVILPEAVTMEFLNSQDIKLNLLHNRDNVIGRCINGADGNMRITRDEKGVYFEVDVVNCDLGIRARELVKAGVFTGCSFEFWPEEYDVEERELNGKHDVKVIHKKLRSIGAWQWTLLTSRQIVAFVNCMSSPLRLRPRRIARSAKSARPSSVHSKQQPYVSASFSYSV